jgi:hypothetical protein
LAFGALFAFRDLKNSPRRGVAACALRGAARFRGD